MTDLLDLSSGNGETMTSREIAELTGKRHTHVMDSIRNLNKFYTKDGRADISVGQYKALNGEMKSQFILNKRQALDLAMGYSLELRIKIADRWEELEKKNQIKVPQTFSEALLLAGEQARIIEEQGTKIQLDAPKVEFSDAVAESKGDYDVGQYAQSTWKELRLGRTNMFKKLRELGYLKLNNCPYQKYIDLGIFKVVTNSYDNHYRNVPTSKTIITGKGQVYLLTRLKKNR